jgi:acetyl esterase
MSIREYPMSSCQPEANRCSRLTFSARRCCAVVVLLVSPCSVALGQPERPLDLIAAGLQPTQILTYKRVAGLDLKMHVFEPPGHMASDRRSVFMIIHGGGWTGGNAVRCFPFADYFRERGMLAISIEYRLLKKNGTSTVFDCVRDGRSAVRYLRQHCSELGIDPQKIVVAGCSAGGHVAAGTSLFSGIDDSSDDAAVSCIPNALVLYYPVIDTSSEGYGQKKIGDSWQQISPLHQVRANAPPTIIFHGTNDTVTPYAGAVRFRDRMLQAGNRCELVSHKNGGHGYVIFDLGLFRQAIERTQRFTEQTVR